ncbi:MAG: SAM hydrolase/SAM-dependent halogenase family protein [Bacteroidota bacterium]
MSTIITLTTDFGQRDAYVAAMKGVLLSVTPQAVLVDVSHEICPQDVMEAAFVLRSASPLFPEGTVHLVVVDPGVGTTRRPVALRHRDHFFVGPDNGVFSLVVGDEASTDIVELDRKEFWRVPAPSSTFHGRDIFAPIAAHLAGGKCLSDVGSPVDRLSSMRWALPSVDEHGVQGWIVHIDRFGNCITNISSEISAELTVTPGMKCFVGSAVLTQISATYGSVATGEPLLLINSDGFLEIAVNGGSASDLFGIRRGASVNIVLSLK